MTEPAILVPEIYDSVVHAQLRKDAVNISAAANIPEGMLWESMVGKATNEEVEYVRDIRKHTAAGVSGLIYEGVPSYSLIQRFQLVTGTLLRNFVNAKIMTLQSVLEALYERKMPRPSVLLIPNFFDTGTTSVLDWQHGLLLDALMKRNITGQQTILYATRVKDVGSAYGDTFEKFLVENYKIHAVK